MKKQFITIACTLVAIIVSFANSQAQDLAFVTATPYTVVLNLSALGAEPVADPSNSNPAEALDLTGKGLHELPSEALTSTAEVITLDSNLLAEISVTAGQWAQCRQLFARHNWLEEFPKGITNMGSLELMDLTRNHIDLLPAGIGELTSMKTLVLDLNFISELPAEVGQMRSLEELSIRWNSMTRLPAEIAQLSNLEVLDLNNNDLTTLPSQIGDLTSLKVLRLSNNNLQHLPAELANLSTTLKVLDLRGNPLRGQWLSEVKAMLPNTQIEF